MRTGRTTDGPLVVSGANGVLELLRSGATVERLLLGDGPRRAELLAEGRRRGLVAVDADRATLDRIAGRPGHQGAVAVAAPFRYASLETIAESRSPLVLVLDNVQDPRNLGALLRTARAAGAGGVVLPRDRSVGVTSVVAVASAGTLFGLPIVRVPNLVRAMNSLKAFGFWLVGLVPSSPAVSSTSTPRTGWPWWWAAKAPGSGSSSNGRAISRSRSRWPPGSSP